LMFPYLKTSQVPFALSLSKCPAVARAGFDKLSPNGGSCVVHLGKLNRAC
jgi:hypothetical protein